MSNSKKIVWYNLAFMAFSTVWGFGNVVNGFVYFNGVQVIFSWIMMFALYFVPYALMVGELGSAFKNAGGGVSSWIQETLGPKLAYYAGWTYWVVHMPYIASKASGGLKALSWVFFGYSPSPNYYPGSIFSICLGSITGVKSIKIIGDYCWIVDVCKVNFIYYLNDGSTGFKS